MEEVIGVFDIGKTNKKLSIYTPGLELLETRNVQFDEIKYCGYPCEDIKSICSWIIESIRKSAIKYRIQGIAFSTHGAAALFLDKEGVPVLPLFSYTIEIEKEIEQDFLNAMGGPEMLQRQTGTTNLPNLLNLAKAIFWVKKKFPEEYNKCHRILSYPSYLGYLLTGEMSAEATFLGCHTFLFDFRKKDWSYVKNKLFSSDKMPFTPGYPQDPLGSLSDNILLKTDSQVQPLITYGIHDSNAALIPFILHKKNLSFCTQQAPGV